MNQANAQADSLATTRAALHAVAEHVLAAARYRSTGRIGLAVSPGGLTPAPFGEPSREIAVDGDDLVVRTVLRDEVQDDEVQVVRAPLRTLRDAAEHAGISPGGPAEVYTLSTPCDPDAPLAIDPDAARRLAE